MDRGAWWAPVHGIVKSQTRLKQLNNSVCVYIYPLGLALGSPIFPSGCEGEGKLGVALESLQGLRDLT